MFSNRLAFAALAVACIGAAAGGGYLASRQAATSTAASSFASTPLAESPSPTPVRETEAVIDDVPLKASQAPSSPSAPVKRSDPAPRTAQTSASSRPSAPGTRSSEPLPTLDRTWPSSAAGSAAPASQSGSGPTAGTPVPWPSPDPASQAGRTEDRPFAELPRPVEPPQNAFEELVVPSESVIGLQAETPVTSDRARIEDRIEARVTRDVRVHDLVAIPAGTRALGSVTQVERGGRFKERARLGIRFHTLVLADGTRLPIQTETIYRYGEAPGNDSAAKIGGGATIGAIIGAIVGGGKGAAIGASAGAGAGTASVMSGDRSSATVHPGEPITVRITSPVTVTVEQK
jgi:hypothetical protein